MPDDLKRLRELLEKATPRPWQVARGGSGMHIVDPEAHWIAECISSHDRAFIVAAINALPALLDRLEKAEQLYQEVRERHGPRDQDVTCSLCAALEAYEKQRAATPATEDGDGR